MVFDDGGELKPVKQKFAGVVSRPESVCSNCKFIFNSQMEVIGYVNCDSPVHRAGERDA